MAPIRELQLRVATISDVAGMGHCRLTDPAAGLADERMSAYFQGQHHPQQALLPRVGYVALVNDSKVGYIAGHLTTRHACAGEVQYLFVAPAYRRRGVAAALLRQLATWFREEQATKVCVCVDPDSPAAQPFYQSLGASPFRKYWYAWEDIGVLLD
jgi:ribosomal protein S18 acetylase RimI-like enzyme